VDVRTLKRGPEEKRPVTFSGGNENAQTLTREQKVISRDPPCGDSRDHSRKKEVARKVKRDQQENEENPKSSGRRTTED